MIGLPAPVPDAAPSLMIDQLYVTHCLYDQGLQQQAGFGVRAASTRDAMLLRFAREYPPFDFPTSQPAFLGEAARRLALARIPGGALALIHSVPLATSRHGRENNYFSHVLTLPALGAREALTAWGSPEWVTDYPDEGSKELAPLTALPRHGPLHDLAVTELLAGPLPANEGLVAAGLCPPRLAGEQARRRAVLTRLLRGCLRVLPLPPADPRRRLYLVAEPGLAALLLYAAARLLPPSLAAELTFSTCEDSRRALMTYRSALVVGTLPAESGGELDQAFFTTRGYAVDSIHDRCSPELESHQERVVQEWVELAARGDWKLLDRVYSLLGRGAAALTSFRDGLHAARLAHRLVKGEADGADLSALQNAPWAGAVLSEHSDRLLPLLTEAGRDDARLRQGLAPLLPGHADQVEQQLAEALRAEPPGDWQGPWKLLETIWKDQPARLREALRRTLPRPPYPANLRLALLHEVHRHRLCPPTQQLPLHTLLRRCSAAELEQLASSGLPRDWYAWALGYALVSSETQGEAVRLLVAADDEVLRTFWKALAQVRADHQGAILDPVLAGTGSGTFFLSRSLRSQAGIPPRLLGLILDRLELWSPQLLEFWTQNDHLSLLLDQLCRGGAEADPLWQRLLRLLDSRLLTGEDPFQKMLLGLLASRRDRSGVSLPEGASRPVTDWITLCEHYELASAVSEEQKQVVLAAHERLRVDPVEALGRYFQRYLLPQEPTRELLDDFVGFFHSFFPDGSSYQSHASRLFAWLDVVRCCPDEPGRAVYQSHYLEHGIPLEIRGRLGEQARLAGKLHPAALLSVPLPEKAPLPAAPAPTPTETPVPRADDTLVFQLTGAGTPGEETRSAVLAYARGSCWLAVALLAGALAALAFSMSGLSERKIVLLAPFLPLILVMAEGAAAQAASLAVQVSRGRGPRQDLAGTLLTLLLIGIVLSILGGVLAAGVALAVGASTPTTLWLGVTVLVGQLGGAAFGLLLPLLVTWTGLSRYVAAAPVARVLGHLTATGTFIALAHWLLG